jgi:hypothetical protein
VTDASFLIQRGFDFGKWPKPREKRYIFTLVGSSRFPAAHADVMRKLTLMGFAVIPLGLYGHMEGMDMDGPDKALVDALHLDKIDASDGIFVVNPEGYIGASTSAEIAHAVAAGKDVIYLDDPAKLTGTHIRVKDASRASGGSEPRAGERSLRWIPVDERLPEREGNYLVYAPGFSLIITSWFDVIPPAESNGRHWRTMVPYSVGAVTHWMPLPDPPES